MRRCLKLINKSRPLLTIDLLVDLFFLHLADPLLHFDFGMTHGRMVGVRAIDCDLASDVRVVCFRQLISHWCRRLIETDGPGLSPIVLRRVVPGKGLRFHRLSAAGCETQSIK